jgi:RHS repeat-associated protein
LARSRHATSSPYAVNGNSFYHADGNGNVTYLASSSGGTDAAYRYDPFGRWLVQTGPYASANVMRFSSKPWIAHNSSNTDGLYYYGYRFYDPLTQKWPNRDPIGEKADLNLYRFNYNAPINYVDPDGLWGIQFGDFNIGWGDPNLAFDWDSWGDLGQGAAATADGLLDAATFNGAFGLFDPGVFGRLGAYDPCDPLLRTSRGLGEVGGALLLAGSGPRGPLFGRGGPWGRGAGRPPGIFNRGDRLRVGWSWNNASDRNWFSIHGGGRGAGPHWHWDIIPGPGNPTIWW